MDDLNTLIKIFETRVHTMNTKLRLEKSFNYDNLILNKPALDNAWLSGFIDAEGCFRIKFEANGSLKLIFEISQKEEFVLLAIKEILNITASVRKSGDIWVLSVYSKINRNSLIEYLQKFPLHSHKSIIFNKWL